MEGSIYNTFFLILCIHDKFNLLCHLRVEVSLFVLSPEIVAETQSRSQLGNFFSPLLINYCTCLTVQCCVMKFSINSSYCVRVLLIILHTFSAQVKRYNIPNPAQLVFANFIWSFSIGGRIYLMFFIIIVF
jgi:hypothetical protein